MTKPESHTFLGPDDAAKASMYHPVLLTLIENNLADFTGIATIEFRHGCPHTDLPFKILPTPEGRWVMTLLARSRLEFAQALDDFALWTPNYAEFFDLESSHPVLLLDAFEQ